MGRFGGAPFAAHGGDDPQVAVWSQRSDQPCPAHGGDQAECLSDTHGLAQNREAALGGEVVEGLLHHRPYVLVDRVDIRVLAELLGEVDRV